MKRLAPRNWLENLLADLRRTTGEHGSLRQRCRERPSPHAIHALRVSSRRLLVMTEIIAAATEVPWKKLRRKLKRVLRTTAESRDLHVQRRRLRAILRDRPELGELERCWRRREQAETAELHDALRLHKLSRQLARFIFDAAATQIDPQGNAAALGVVHRMLLHRGALASVHRGTPIELHRARLASKRARYVCESLEACAGLKIAAWTGGLRRRQRTLGEIHDLDVLLDSMGRYARSHAALAAPIRKLRPQLRQQRTQLLRRYRRQRLSPPPRPLQRWLGATKRRA